MKTGTGSTGPNLRKVLGHLQPAAIAASEQVVAFKENRIFYGAILAFLVTVAAIFETVIVLADIAQSGPRPLPVVCALVTLALWAILLRLLAKEQRAVKKLQAELVEFKEKFTSYASAIGTLRMRDGEFNFVLVDETGWKIRQPGASADLAQIADDLELHDLLISDLCFDVPSDDFYRDLKLTMVESPAKKANLPEVLKKVARMC